MSGNRLPELPDISFVDSLSVEDLKTTMVNNYLAKYEEVTGSRTTLEADNPIRLMLYACALPIFQAFQLVDRAGKQNLLKYSYGKGFFRGLCLREYCFCCFYNVYFLSGHQKWVVLFVRFVYHIKYCLLFFLKLPLHS